MEAALFIVKSEFTVSEPSIGAPALKMCNNASPVPLLHIKFCYVTLKLDLRTWNVWESREPL